MKSNLNLRYILLISLVAAFGGFLFGYDTAVVSGAIGFLTKHFQLSAELSGWAASSLLVGCMFGAVLGGPLGDRFGRKPSLIACATLFAAIRAAGFACLVCLGAVRGRPGDWSGFDSFPRLHRRDCAGENPRAARGLVSTRHRERHSRGVLCEPANSTVRR